MNNIVKFNDKPIDLIWHNEQWNMTLPQIEGALEFAQKGKAISNLYNAHKDEFDAEMTCIIRKGNTRIRIFNREGAWLISMFARTPKAAEFRKWVLKVLGAVADNLSPVDKPVLVSEHTRALPSGKKEIVLSEKAKQEIGGIVKVVANKAVEDYFNDRIDEKFMVSMRNWMKEIVTGCIRAEIAPYMLKDGVKQTEAFNGSVTADGLPVANWIVGIIHGANALDSCIKQLKNKQNEAVKLLEN